MSFALYYGGVFRHKLLQAMLQSVEAELAQLRDTTANQKKRLLDTVTGLLKDLGDIGYVIGGDFKVTIIFHNVCLKSCCQLSNNLEIRCSLRAINLFWDLLQFFGEMSSHTC